MSDTEHDSVSMVHQPRYTASRTVPTQAGHDGRRLGRAARGGGSIDPECHEDALNAFTCHPESRPRSPARTIYSVCPEDSFDGSVIVTPKLSTET